MATEEGWSRILAEKELPIRKPVTTDSPWGRLMLYRTEERIYGISNVCAHQGAPLDKGPVDARGRTPIATCPLHGSMFDLETGAVRRGPAMSAVAAYDVRANGGTIEARPRDAG